MIRKMSAQEFVIEGPVRFSVGGRVNVYKPSAILDEALERFLLL